MNDLKQLHFKRRETEFTGGDDVNGEWVPAQRITIGKCADEDEDIWTVTTALGKTHRVDGCDLHPHPESELTNVEFLTLMLERSRTAMIQPFVLYAVEEFAKQVANKTAEELETAMISGALWKDTAQEALGWFAAREFITKERRREPA